MARAVARTCAALCVVVFAFAAAAAEPLFPTPLHLTRQVYDPISDTTAVLEEYGYGNRLVSIRGHKTSIADYERAELTEIDRKTSTYSVTRFDAIAKLAVATSAPAAGGGKSPNVGSNAAPNAARLAPRSLGMKATKHGRNAEFFESELPSQDVKQKMEIAVDRTAYVSREALEVLLGSAYPGVRRPEHDAVLTVAAPARSNVTTNASSRQAALYALPVEQTVTYDLDGRSVEFRTSVVRVGAEAPPADLVTIPAGARLVTSRIVAVQNELEIVNRPATASPNVP